VSCVEIWTGSVLDKKHDSVLEGLKWWQTAKFSSEVTESTNRVGVQFGIYG